MKGESLQRTIITGATGSIVGTAIWKLAADEVSYSSFGTFLSSDVAIPVWSLILISMLVAFMLHIVYLTKKHANLQIKLKNQEVESELSRINELSDDPKKLEKIKSESARKTKIAKRVVSFLKEDYPKKSDELCELIIKTGDFAREEVQDAIDDLVHFQSD